MRSGDRRIFEFGAFRLDRHERRLSREGRIIPLRAKVFDTLCVLLESPGQLVTKEKLMRRVWPGTAVEEGNLAHNISVLRKTLGSQNAGEDYIETVAGHGYRFAAEVREIEPPGPRTAHLGPRPEAPPQEVPVLFERERELETLHGALDAARQGHRQVVFVTGEIGMGKTSLVEAFARQARSRMPLWLGCGQCPQYRGEAEPYLPVLEALGRMCGQSHGELIPLLVRCAPLWAAQMPWLLTDSDLQALQTRLLGATRERMLREMAETVGVLTAGKPLLLVLEDLHWSDPSTVELVARLAAQAEPARLLVVGTYRASVLRRSAHPLLGLVRDLKPRGLALELPLPALSEGAVEEYLTRRLGATVPTSAARLVHRRTEGIPLFLAAVTEHWVMPVGDRTRSWGAETDIIIPHSLRELIEEQFSALEPADRNLLEIASVLGREFSAVTVAAVAGLGPGEAEPACERLAKQGALLRRAGVDEWPDGSISSRYGFTHDLYRELLYDNLPAGRRAELHQRAGAQLEASYGGSAPQRAAELAHHFVNGREPRRAVHHLVRAAQQALRCGACQEASCHLEKARAILSALPLSHERVQQEIVLLATLGPAIMMAQGLGAEEARTAYRRALELSRHMDDPPERASVIVGLATVCEVRGEYRRAQAILEDYLQTGPSPAELELAAECYDLLACSLFHQGSYRESLAYARQAMAPRGRETVHPVFPAAGVDATISARCWAALNLWFLGRADQALEAARRAVSEAEQHPYARALALTQMASLHQLRNEPQAVLAAAKSAQALATEKGFPYWDAAAGVLYGWGLAVSGRASEGIARLLSGYRGCRAAGVEMDRPYCLGLLAEAYLCHGEPEQALIALDEALALVSEARGFFYEAELHRLRGCALLQAGSRTADEAAASCRRALDVALRQEAPFLQLRAAVILARLSDYRTDERVRDLLESACAALTEGRDTPDIRSAREVLHRLTARAAKGSGAA